jgi:hypothetical protein
LIVHAWVPIAVAIAHAAPSPPPTRSAPENAASYEVRDLDGFRVHVNKAFLAHDPKKLERVLLQARADLDEVAHFVTPQMLAVLHTVELWVEENGTHDTARNGHGMCQHASKSWLTEHGLLPEKAGHFEIINPDDFLTWRRDQPYMLFHEMAHAVQWRLSKSDAEIRAAHDDAMAHHLYEAVPRNTVPQSKTGKAYAAENEHEYFAELSEAYFALNDFYPYSRAQLADYDRRGFALMEKFWDMSARQLAENWAPQESGIALPASFAR